MQISITDEPLVWRSLIVATLFALGLIHIAFAIRGALGGMPYTQAVAQHWVIMWVVPAVYGLTHAVTSRPATIAIAEVNLPEKITELVNQWTERQGYTPTQTGDHTSYIPTGGLRRLTERCFGMFMQMRQYPDRKQISITGNRNIIKYLLPEIRQLSQP